MSFAFDPRQPVARNLAREAAAQIEAALDVARDDTLPAGQRVQVARTSCKRVRGLLKLLEPAFAAGRDENAALRDAAALLSGARDAGTFRATLATLTDRSDAFTASENERFGAAADDDQPGGAPDEQAALARFAAALEPIRARARLWDAVPLDWQDVANGAACTYRRARRAMRRADRTRSAGDLHEWRKHAKYHWYHLRLLRRFDADRVRPARERAKRLAALLGEHHDLDVLTARIAARLAGDPELSARLAARARLRQDALAAEALSVGADLFGDRTRAWREALERRISEILREGGAVRPEPA